MPAVVGKTQCSCFWLLGGAAVRFTRSNYFWVSCFCTTFLGNVSWQIFLFIFWLIKENWTRDYYSLKTSSFKDLKKKVGCYFSPLLPLSIQGRLRPPVWQVLGWVPWGPDSGRIFLSQVSNSLENAGKKQSWQEIDCPWAAAVGAVSMSRFSPFSHTLRGESCHLESS